MEYIIKKHRHSHRKLLILLLVCLSGLSSPPDAEGQAVLGARELSMGQATTALPNSSWSVFGNPAMISDQRPDVSFFGVRYFGLAEITDMAAAVNYPTDIGVFSAGAHRYGYDLFNESRLRMGYKHSVAGFHYGIVLNYNHVIQGGGYGSAGAFGVDLGVAASVVPGLWIGAKAINLNQPAYGSLNDEELPRNLSVGLSYFLSDIALFSTEIFKDVRFPVAFRSGIEVNIIAGLMGRAGITTAPQTFAAGFGYESRLWGASVGVQRHENNVLGYSPAIDFKVRW
ncbi:hypothetical protein LQ318_06865 [Aliifodinibius salicampi]|uniref:MetA-pathway of phenol degradation n=1 Tax=Fodinibius salicampi TaxID=1920655 RepID=A0ABT3PXN7_9BACT|nr:hypothetical protein [Fodinibius salicampi]MCW9712620.1 hypothetical protein [Fodinibius salicampi]